VEKRVGLIDTQLIHAGERSPRIEGAVTMPIFQSSTFAYRGENDYHSLRYIRLNNTPNHIALHEKLAAIENGQAAVVTASGMSAVSATLLSILGSGDHLVVQDSLYGGTHDLLNTDMQRLGIAHEFIDGSAPESWARALRPTTKAIYVESISNPLLRVADLEAVVSFAGKHRLISIIDNTFATPINFRPLTIGFDISIHSGTKYLNGHSDIVAGAVIGRAELVDKINRTLGHLGAPLDPHACFLLHRGMKTLAVRVRHQNASALTLAQYLQTHPKITQVNYPGLENHPDHRRARRLFSGNGGVLSFELRGGLAAAEALMGALQLPIPAPSLGGVEALITRPSTTSHSGMSAEARNRAGIRDELIRLSVGLEAPEDLINDFEQALNRV
jgi:cystathionine beta-lyase/cystathionine gamma-synthase